MGFVKDLGSKLGLDKLGLGAATPGTLTSFFDPGDLLGTHRAGQALDASERAQALQEQARLESIAERQRAAEAAQGFLEPFAGVGAAGVEQAGFLTDPQAQFDFLQQNPLFQSALENANQQTLQAAASRGRLSAGDTLQRLSQNTLLAAQPLIGQQKQSITDLLNFGSGIGRAQSNIELGLGSDVGSLIETGGNIGASGTLGRNQIIADTTANQNALAAQVAAAFFTGGGSAAAGAGGGGGILGGILGR